MNFSTSILYLLVLVFIGVGCAPSNQQTGDTSAYSYYNRSLDGSLALPQQTAPPNDIQSIQLYPQGNPGAAPIIKLDSQEKLVLAFDYLGEQSRQFRIEVSHRTQNWDQSGIGPSTYLNSFSQTYVQDSKASFSKRPSYFHVNYTFPNNELRPAVSGNYLLEVYSYEGDKLFSMPFFITEDTGEITSRIERIYAQRDDGRPLDQPFTTYQYPDFVEYPQFDLSVSFVQNQFWGQMKEADFLDTISPGELHGYLNRRNAYVGNYEFKFLDLGSFNVDGQQILEYQPEVTPPKIILRRDVQNLDTSPRLSSTAALGIPLDERSSDYAQVEFRLQTEAGISTEADIYLVGHFNNWMINDLNKMTYHADERMWKGRALIKQGQYAYKYVQLTNSRIDGLALDQGFLSSQQEYLNFIYFKDPDQKFDRILKVDRIIQR